MVADMVVVVAVAAVVVAVAEAAGAAVVVAAGVEIDFKTDGFTTVRGSGRDISLWPKRTEIRFYLRLLKA